MVPQQVRRLERIPLTEQGKIDRAALRAMLDAASDTHVADQASEAEVQPVAVR
jgi:acyl-coenzyme A synthetase/AMP-(fatty) acid ligase